MFGYGDGHSKALWILLVPSFIAAAVVLGMYLIPTVSTIMATLTSF